jgi:hypothetical protein
MIHDRSVRQWPDAPHEILSKLRLTARGQPIDHAGFDPAAVPE